MTGFHRQPTEGAVAHVTLWAGMMQRLDLYIKVQVVLDDDEKPDRVAAEICRQLEKLYVVGSAELSNSVTRE